MTGSQDVSRVVVVGGGLAGARTVEALRQRGCTGSLTLVCDEPHLPYERPPLSKEYLQGKAGFDKAVVHPEQWYADNDVMLLRGTTATAIDRASRTVVLDQGDDLPYDRLVLATGSSPLPLDVAGSDLDGIHYLRSVDDSDRLHDVLAVASRVTVVGGGWIGLEVAAAARLAGAEVTLIESGALPLGRVLGPEMAEVFADLHRRHGVDVRTEVGVGALTGDDGRVVAVQLDDGTAVVAEAVVVGIGIAPDVRLAADAGLEVDDGVLVDEQLRTSDPDIFAVGDVANAWHPVLRRRIRVEHWANARNQPEVAAAALLGGDDVYDRQPFFFTDQYDLGMEYRGYAEPGGYDAVVTRGDVAGHEFLAFWTAQGVVQAAMNVNVWDQGDAIEAIVASQQALDLGRLADPTVPLTHLIP